MQFSNWLDSVRTRLRNGRTRRSRRRTGKPSAVASNRAELLEMRTLLTTPAFGAPQLNPDAITGVAYSAAPTFADIDGDGDFDIITGEAYGNFRLFENIGSATAPVFGAAQLNPHGLANIGGDSAPSFGDIDGDGDLDLIAGTNDGNFRLLENTGSATAPAFGAPQLNPHGLLDIGILSAPTLGDIDGDGDLDLIAGANDGNFQLFENTGSAIAPAFGAPQVNPHGLTDIGVSSSPSLEDIDGDGDLDIIAGDDTGNFRLFENTGSATAPAFGAAQLNPFGLVDIGRRSKPSLGDIDSDGDLDLIAGSYYGNFHLFENTATTPAFPAFIEKTGVDNPLDGASVGANEIGVTLGDFDGDGNLDLVAGSAEDPIAYFKNTGTITSPMFTQQTGMDNPIDPTVGGDNAAPTAADIDGDGDLDLIIGNYDGGFDFFKNTGNATNPVFTEQTGAANPFDGLDTGLQATPALGDVDGDGDLDLIAGEYYGEFRFFQNTGTATAPAFVELTGAANPLDGQYVGAEKSALTIGDVDGDGDLDIVAGNYDGESLVFENTGDPLAPVFTPRTGAANPLEGVDVGFQNAPVFGDLDGDGDLDLVIAEYYGTFRFFESIPAPDTTVKVSNGILTITDTGDTSDDDLTISFSGGTYTIVDNGGIQMNVASITGATGNDTSSVTVPDTGVTGIVIHTGGGNNRVAVNSVQASLPDGVVSDSASLINAGTNSVTLNGTLLPDQAPDTLPVVGDLTLDSNAILEASITGETPGTQLDQIDVTGTVDVSGATLNVDDTGFTASGTESFVLIANDGADPVTGAFDGLPEGGGVLVGGHLFSITYVGGDGNDVAIEVLIDYGDAPDISAGTGTGDYQTTMANGGPSHVVRADLRLGGSIDGESDGQPTATADGDDNNFNDDEDGLFDPAADLTLTEGISPLVRAIVTNETGSTATLSGWIDYNADGVFDNATERAQLDVASGTVEGVMTLTFPAPVIGSAGETFARFRLSTDSAAEDPIGAATDGEVEDYAVRIFGALSASPSVELLSGADPGELADAVHASDFQLSDDGRFLVFSSTNANIVPGQIDHNLTDDIFLVDRMTGTVSLVSHTGDGVTTGNGRSSLPQISGDGSTVVFQSQATNLLSGFVKSNDESDNDVFRSVSGTVTLVSGVGGSATHGGDGSSEDASISDDGSNIAFLSSATDLVGGFVDNNGGSDKDVFLSASGTISLISGAGGSATEGGDRRSDAVQLSGDGSTVVFESNASDLIAGFVDNNNNPDIFKSTAGTISLVSRDAVSATTAGNTFTRLMPSAVSDDGSVVVFESFATNLVAGFIDNNGLGGADVFQNSAGTVSLLSGAGGSATTGGNDRSTTPIVSGDGSTVVFQSGATDLVAGFVDNNGAEADLFKNVGGTISLVSGAGGSATQGADASVSDQVVSDDGSIIVFESSASNLVAGLTDVIKDNEVFVSSGGTISLVSHIPGSATTAGNGSSGSPALSGDGSIVAFRSRAVDLVSGQRGVARLGLHVNTLTTLTNELPVTTAFPNVTGDESSEFGQTSRKVSDDGRFVVFESRATNLVAGQTDVNGDREDIFLFDRLLGTTTLLSHTGDGMTTGNDRTEDPQISGDGSTVYFLSDATDLVPGFVPNSGEQLYRWRNGVVTLVSGAGGSATVGSNNSPSTRYAVNEDGNVVAFASGATDLVAGFVDNGGAANVYRIDNGVISLVSGALGSATASSNADSTVPEISDDGMRIVFRSEATDLITGFVENNGEFESDIFLSDNGTLSLVTHASGSSVEGGDGDSAGHTISSDGNVISFQSAATNLVAGFVDNNGMYDTDVFLSTSGVISLISGANGSATDGGNAHSQNRDLSGDGGTVVLTSNATDLVPGYVAGNSTQVYKSTSGTVSLVTGINGSATAGSAGSPGTAQVNTDGSVIAFRQDGDDLIPGLFNTGRFQQAFVSVNGTMTLASHAAGNPLVAGTDSVKNDVLMSADGSVIVFSSEANNLVLNDFSPSNQSNVFAFSTLPEEDYGDAPDSTIFVKSDGYPTRRADDGARHTATGPTLGALRDVEIDGQPSAAADSDDLNGAGDDEDGVTFPGPIEFAHNRDVPGSVQVDLQNPDPVSNLLDAWIDFNGDGDWLDPGERILTNFDLGTTAGVQTVSFTVPQGAVAGDTFARFRLSTAGGLAPTGAAADGEVEDHPVTLKPNQGSIVGRDPSSGNWWLGRSDGTSFTNQLWGTWQPTITWLDATIGDFNNDGYDDIAGRQQSDGRWWVALSDGLGGSVNQLWGQWDDGVAWTDVSAADVNGDGHDDLIGRQPGNGNWWVGLSDGVGSFTNQLWGHWAPSSTWVDVNTADVNGDGNADLVGRELGSGKWWVALSDGAGSFTNQNWGLWTPIPWVDVNVADVNGDGNDDVVGRQQSNGNWWVALSDGAGSFANQLWGNWAPVPWVNVNVADVNGDGNDDVVGRQQSNGNWWVAMSDGAGSFTNQLWGLWSAGSTWVDVQVSDVDGDGDDDVVGREQATGNWWTARSDGTSAFTNELWGQWDPTRAWSDVGILEDLLSLPAP